MGTKRCYNMTNDEKSNVVYNTGYSLFSYTNEKNYIVNYNTLKQSEFVKLVIPQYKGKVNGS
jgi:hypothetical protein